MKTVITTRLTTAALAALAFGTAPLALARANDNEKPASTSLNQPDSTNAGSTESPSVSAAAETKSATADASRTDPSTAKDEQSGATHAQAAASSTSTDQNSGAASSPSGSMAATKTPGSSDAKRDTKAIQIATKDAEEHTAKKLAGADVRGSGNQQVGEIKDLLLDTQSGKVAFAIVSSGGFLGLGDELRLVPFTALQPGAKEKEFTVNLDEAQWKALATVEEKDWKNGTFTMSDAQSREIARHFSRPDARAEASAYYTASISHPLIRASALEDRDVVAGTDDAGKIRAVVVDVPAGTASVLFDPARNFTRTEQKFLVPIEQLSISGAERLVVSMTLSQAEFQDVQTGGETASTSAFSENGIASTTINQSGAVTNEGTTSTGDNKAAASATGSSAVASDTNTTARGQTTAGADTANAKSGEELSATGRTSTDSTSSVASDQTTESKRDMTPADQANATASTDSTAQTKSATDKQKSDQSEAVAKTSAATTEEGSRMAANETKKSDTDTAAPASSTAARSTEQSQDVAAVAPKEGTEPEQAKATSGQSIAASSEREDSSPKTTQIASSEKNDTQAVTGDVTTSSSPSAGTNQESVAANSPAPSSRDATTAAASTSAASTSDENLTPTGKTSAEQNPDADPALVSAARAIRKALDDDPAVARADVRVTPENGKLFLRGSVDSASTKRTIEQKAEKAASGQEIESELKVGEK